MAHEVSASKTTHSLPHQRTENWESAADRAKTEQTGEPVRPLSLDRLLSGAVLTPGQAALVAVGLLDAAGDGTVDGGHPASGRLGAVGLTVSGDVEVAPADDEEGTPVDELLGRLLHNARRLPAHPRPEQLQLLHRLEEAAGARSLEPSSRARALEAALADAFGPGYRQRLSGQLSALVEAFSQVAPGVQTAGNAAQARMTLGAPPGSDHAAWGTSGPSRHAPRRAAPARTASTRSSRRSRVLMHHRRRGWRVALLVLVVAAVLAGGGYLLIRGPGAGIVSALGLGNQPAAPTTTAPAHPAKQRAQHRRAHRHHRQAVPALAARHAGPVTQVTVRKTRSCKPGAQCPVRVTVHLRPSPTARTVAWKVGAARLCKGGVTWSRVTTVTAHPGWTTVFAHSSVRVPQGRSMALTALTTKPTRAQSPPIPVTGSSLHC